MGRRMARCWAISVCRAAPLLLGGISGYPTTLSPFVAFGLAGWIFAGQVRVTNFYWSLTNVTDVVGV